MKMLSLLLLMTVMLCPLLPAAEPVVVVPITPAVEADDDSPQAAMRRMSRADRKLAREVVRDAADAAGMRRLEFMRAVQDEDPDAMDELKVSLAQHDDALRFDPDEFGQFLTMILEFIEKLLAIFAMFADAGSLDALNLWCVNIGYQMAA